MLQMLNPVGRPVSPAYSQAVLAVSPQRTLYISGQVGVRSDGSVPSTIGEQVTAAIENLDGVLASAEMNRSHLAKLTIYLTDPADLPGFMEAAADTLPFPPPATTLLIVKGLATPELKIEIEAIAAA